MIYFRAARRIEQGHELAPPKHAKLTNGIAEKFIVEAVFAIANPAGRYR